ncbi:MAG TPA: transposase [Steroidobacteraceae bacterium]|nr:transposase [Steroidobacteraceae bacterium]
MGNSGNYRDNRAGFVLFGTDHVLTLLLKKAELTRASGATGAVTLIQRFGSTLNLNIHFHMLVLDGAYLVGTEPPVFRRVAPPREAELQALVERLAERIGRALERQGVRSGLVYSCSRPASFGPGVRDP